MKTVIKVEGLKELQAALSKLPDKLSREVQFGVLERAAAPIAARAAELAPRDQGDLHKSITVSRRLSKRQYSLHRKADPTDVEVYVGAGSLPHAHLQEYGTKNITPQPFMRPAWDAARPTIVEVIKNDLWEKLK